VARREARRDLGSRLAAAHLGSREAGLQGSQAAARPSQVAALPNRGEVPSPVGSRAAAGPNLDAVAARLGRRPAGRLVATSRAGGWRQAGHRWPAGEGYASLAGRWVDRSAAHSTLAGRPSREEGRLANRPVDRRVRLVGHLVRPEVDPKA